MLMAWENWRATRAYWQGNINLAVSHLRQSQQNQNIDCATGRNLARKLTRTLIQRAQYNTSINNLPAAWRDLTSATEIAHPTDQDRLSKHKSKLVDLTIESADAQLSDGKTTLALTLIFELESRRILDWRSDRISKTARLIQSADTLAAEGHLQRSNEKLEQAIYLRPDLSLLTDRRKANHLRTTQIDQLSKELQTALLDSQWNRVGQICKEILVIAPNYQVALEARRRLLERQKTSKIKNSRSPSETTPSFKTAKPTIANSQDNQQFMLWVDSIGGFLVCPSQINIIGCAIAQANIEIPIMADLSRRHVKIEAVNDTHLIRPLTHLAKIELAGQPIATAAPWGAGKILELDGGVKIEYTRPHQSSSSARLNLISRHRTHPWSDAVLLANDKLILGPDPNNHIYCPHWSHNVTLFQREGVWYCQSNQSYRVDSQSVQGTASLTGRSRISGTDFSVGLETVSETT